jgi:hypothetical protein
MARKERIAEMDTTGDRRNSREGRIFVGTAEAKT